jgi:two-component system phosphate regulon sensor histidine kinase PhoR
VQKRTVLIFSIFVSYIVFQFLWWEVLLVKQSNEIIKEKQNLVALSSTNYDSILNDIQELESKKINRVYMIVGEGTVFMLILLFGIMKVRRSIKKEIDLNEQQKNFILSVSHELKTPIAASKLQIQTLLKHELDRGKQVEILNHALDETERLNKLVENVLTANQLNNKTNILHKENFNLSALIEATGKRYFSALMHNHSLKMYCEANCVLYADKELIQSVIVNLIENAVKYSFDYVNVLVTLKREDQKFVLEISDSGIGIIETEKEKIFENFYRSGNEDTRRTKGTGIGLFLVKTICDLHQASIAVLSNEPKGSIFKIEFQK